MSFISVGVIVTLALMATAAAASDGGGRVASACLNKRLAGFPPSPTRQVTFRLVLHGKVSCTRARRTSRAYEKAALAGRCPYRICTEATFAGGWKCASSSAVEEHEGAPAFSCANRQASFAGYVVKGPASARSTLHLREFLSPDRKVWCVVEDGGCGTNPQPPTRAAEIHSNGTVRLCFVPEVIYPPGGHVPLGCFDNWNQSAAILPYGQSDLYGAIRCTSAPNGITCVKVSGAGQGKGFRINKDEAVRVG
jgi:hypothetical protein